jgi:hypothetical protein
MMRKIPVHRNIIDSNRANSDPAMVGNQAGDVE